MKKGFTLVEILAVIALLSIVITLAVPSITRLRKDALETEAKNQKNQIESVGVMYSYDKKYYNCYVFVQTLIDEGYLKTNEKDDIVSPSTGESLKGHVVMITTNDYLKSSGSLMKLEDLLTNADEILECGIIDDEPIEVQ